MIYIKRPKAAVPLSARVTPVALLWREREMRSRGGSSRCSFSWGVFLLKCPQVFRDHPV